MHDAGFVRIQQRAECVFAARSRIESVPSSDGADARQAGCAAAPYLAEFATRIDRDELDGLLIELTDPTHGADLDAVARSTRAVLSGLLEAQGTSEAIGLSEVGSEHWWLTLCDTRWFVLVFAPCYDSTSPRHTFGSPSTYVLLQPVASFDRRATPRGATIKQEVRQLIRDSYTECGRQYDAELAQQDVESLKFVWPANAGEQPVRWWEAR